MTRLLIVETKKCMKQSIKKVFRKLGLKITRFGTKDNQPNFVSLKPDKPEKGYKGNVLLSYIIDPFLLKPGELISNAHHHDWLSWQIAQTFLDLGYCVDVIDYRDNKFVPQKDYAFFVGARTNFQRISQLLNEDCVKIVHLDTAHWLYSNTAAYKRCLAVQKRKGITLHSYKMIERNWAIEYADYATTNLGNQFNVSTYSYAKKPIFQIPLPTCTVYPWQKNKNFEACRNQYLWFGSRGLVHKGLDLTLEAFAKMPDCHLTVCGPIHKEKDFENAYYKELYQTPNIHTIGWVNIESSKFIEITNNCIGIIFPSCSEGGGASAITCMQAGLIPIVSYETNVEVGDFGVTLQDCTIDEIKNSVRMISSLSTQDLKLRSRKTWEYARENHTKERFAEEYRKIIEKIINNRLTQDISTV